MVFSPSVGKARLGQVVRLLENQIIKHCISDRSHQVFLSPDCLALSCWTCLQHFWISWKDSGSSEQRSHGVQSVPRQVGKS